MSERCRILASKKIFFKNTENYKFEQKDTQIECIGLNTHYKLCLFDHIALTNCEYFEVTLKSDNLATLRVGFATKKAEKLAPLGYDNYSWCYQTTNGYGIHNSKINVFGRRVYKEETIGCLFNRDLKKIFFYINGQKVQKSFNLSEEDVNQESFPAISCFNSAKCMVNFGPNFGYEDTSKNKQEKKFGV